MSNIYTKLENITNKGKKCYGAPKWAGGGDKCRLATRIATGN